MEASVHMELRSIRERWPHRAKGRDELIERLYSMALDPETDPALVNKICRTLLDSDRLNLLNESIALRRGRPGNPVDPSPAPPHGVVHNHLHLHAGAQAAKVDAALEELSGDELRNLITTLEVHQCAGS